MFGVGIAHGKFGELLQGVLPGEDKNFLVTLPITCYSVAKFHCSHSDKNTIVYPHHKTKSADLVKKIMGYLGVSCGWKLTIESGLEEGKGLGSSTADMVASARAISQALGKNIPIDVLLTFLREIEPSDGIMYEGVVSFYHRKVALHKQLGFFPDLMIIGVDEGGIVDTMKFNQELRPYTVEEKTEYELLLSEILSATKRRDLKKIGYVSTRSAIFNQVINPKKNLSLFVNLCSAVEALGIIVSHSGTYIGIILDKNNPDHSRKITLIEEHLKEHNLTPKKFNTMAGKNEYEFLNTICERTGSV